MSSFDSWSDSHLISPSHLHGTDVAEMIEPPGCAALQGRVAAARMWPPTSWEKVSGTCPLLQLCMSEASVENDRRNVEEHHFSGHRLCHL